MSSEIANQLKSQSLGDVLASTFNTVGGRVFPDLLASQSLADLVKVVDSYRATHAPLYGNPLPNTGTAYTAVGEGSEAIVDLIAPSDNEVVNVNAMSLKNAGGRSGRNHYGNNRGRPVTIKRSIINHSGRFRDSQRLNSKCKRC